MRAVLYVNDYEVDGDEDAKLLFIVECEGKYSVNIADKSYYPEETEHKFVKEAHFKVIEVKKGTLIHITLTGNII